MFVGEGIDGIPEVIHARAVDKRNGLATEIVAGLVVAGDNRGPGQYLRFPAVAMALKVAV